MRQVLGLQAAGVSSNEIARRVGVASVGAGTLERLAVAGLSWPLPAELTDAALGARLFTGPANSRAAAVAPSPLGGDPP